MDQSLQVKILLSQIQSISIAINERVHNPLAGDDLIDLQTLLTIRVHLFEVIASLIGMKEVSGSLVTAD